MLPWLVPEWVQQQIQNAWSLWQVRASLTQLQYGSASSMLEKQGRETLEQCLEPYFSKWVWHWDVARQTASPLHASAASPTQPGIVTECVPGLTSRFWIPEKHLEKPLAWFTSAAQALQGETPIDTFLLYDDQVLWPQAYTPESKQGKLHAHERQNIARYVLAHLVGLGKAREDEKQTQNKTYKPDPCHVEQRMAPNPFPSSETMSQFLTTTSSWLGLGRIWSPDKSNAPEREGEPMHIPKQRSRTIMRSNSIRHSVPENSAGNTRIPLDIATKENGKSDERASEVASPAPIDSWDPSSSEPVPLSSSEHRDPPADAQAEIPIATRIHEPSKLFTSNAPFQALHERLSQALGVEDEASLSTERPEAGALHHVKQPDESSTATNSSLARVPPASTSEPFSGSSKSQVLESSWPCPSTRTDPCEQFPALSASSAARFDPPSHSSSPANYLPHDPALDGWGKEAPQQWQHATLHLNETSSVHVTYLTVRLVLTQRKLLTLVLVWNTKPSTLDSWLDVSWEFLRRSQRVVNDAMLRAPAKSLDFLHMNDLSALTLGDLAAMQHLPEAVCASVEKQLLSAETMMQRCVTVLT